MYFKVVKGTPTFAVISDLWDRIDKARKETQLFINSLGYEESGSYNDYIGGGFDCIRIGHDKPVPPNWKRVGESYERFFFPKKCKENKELLDKIAALPRIRKDDVMEVCGFNRTTLYTYPSTHGIGVFRCPGIEASEKYILIHVEDGIGRWKRPKDMVRISDIEYQKLSASIKRTKAKSQSKVPA